MKLPGTISIDIDTLRSLFKTPYESNEFEEGLSEICSFFEKANIKTTLFFIGQDLAVEKNRRIIQDVLSLGHEIANHTMNHAQGLRFLSREEKEKEISDFEIICEKVAGFRPVGFRAPGWNIDEEILEILVLRGYKYDSSIFPTFLMPLMKGAYYLVKRTGSCSERTTMGKLRYMFCPIEPYRTRAVSFGRGGNGLLEFPITVSPIIRMPLFATMLLKFGMDRFENTFKNIQKNRVPVQFMLHLFDFVDFSKYDRSCIFRLKDFYLPESLIMDHRKKADLIKRAIDMMSTHYEFKPYKERCS